MKNLIRVITLMGVIAILYGLTLNPIETNALQHRSVNTDTDYAIEEGFFTNPAPGAWMSREIQYNHDGLDLAAPYGTPILAAADGTVVHTQNTISNSGGYGYYLILEHTYNNKKLHSLYSHLGKPTTLNLGESVTQGQQIGIMGSTGNSTGNHLHFSIFSEIKMYHNGSFFHPTCTKAFTQIASTCLSPIDNPINIIENIFVEEPIKTTITFSELAEKLYESFDFKSIGCDYGTPSALDTLRNCTTIFNSFPAQNISNKNVNREEFARVIMRTLLTFSQSRSSLPNSMEFVHLKDTSNQSADYPYIQRALRNGIMNSQDDYFGPKQTISPADAEISIDIAVNYTI